MSAPSVSDFIIKKLEGRKIISSKVPNKKIKIFIRSGPFIKKLLSKLLSEIDTLEVVNNLTKGVDVDIIYNIGGTFPINFLINNPKYLFNKTPVVMHWIGSDVFNLMLLNTLSAYLNKYVYTFYNFVFPYKIFHLSVSSWLTDEIKSVNLSSIIFPISTIGHMEKHNEVFFPKIYDVMSYIPKSRFDFYGGKTIIRLANKFPGLNFLIIMPDLNKNQLPSCSLKNLTLISKVAFTEMYKFYKMSKCFLRIPQHDGLSLSVLESLFYELECIWIHDFPYTKKVDRDNFNEIAFLIQKIADNFVPNKKGHKYVLDNYSIDVLKKRYKIIFAKILLVGRK